MKDWISGKCAAIVISAIRSAKGLRAEVDHVDDSYIVIRVHGKSVPLLVRGKTQKCEVCFNIVIPRTATDIYIHRPLNKGSLSK